jgi:hypothetical protein
MNHLVTESIAHQRREKLVQEARTERQRHQVASRHHETHVEPYSKRRLGLWRAIRHALGIFM